jgi:two-component system sensor histidine kinase and response regulator WspE
VSPPSERLLRQFRDLVTVRLERINRALMELESGANAEAGRGVLRELHGLKGESRMMGFEDINTLVHEMEELVRSTEPLRYSLSSESADALLSAADAVAVLSGALRSEDPPPEVTKLVGWLQECVRAEAGRSSGAGAPSAGVAAGAFAATAGPGAPALASTGAVSPGASADASAATASPGVAPTTTVAPGTPAVGPGVPPLTTASPLASAVPRAHEHASANTPAGGLVARSHEPASASAPAGEDGGPSASYGHAPPSASGPAGAHGGPASRTHGDAGPGPAERSLTPARGVPAMPASRNWPSVPKTGAEPSRASGAPAGTGPLLTSAGKLPAPGPALAAAAAVPPSAAASAAASLGQLPAAGGGARAAGAGPGLARQPEARSDAAVRIGVASLDLLTSAVTNLSQVARRRELANVRRLALARELGQLAREAEDLGPRAAALVARLGTAKELAAALHRESKLLSNEELRDLDLIMEEVQGLRMLPLSVLFEPYPRMVRDLSRALGKEVELVVDGEDTRADRAVVEALRDPLMHLVRNALDHGLETRVDRVSSGKHPRGCLTLRAAREGSRIILRVEDDGAGMDPAELRKVAVRKGFLDESAANALSDAAARDLIFLAGFTSREVVTDLSGRGVGLDAVRTSVQALGGDVGVESAPGWGTIFELRVPVSLTVAPLLFIQVGEERLALSASHVSRALKVEYADLCEVAGRPSLLVEGRVLPLAPMATLLGLAPERPVKEGELALVVRSQGGAAALVVDRVLEERVQAILPLKGVLGRFSHLTGATSLADGRLAMVLSAAYLTASATGTTPLRLPRASPRPAATRRRRILVVDDSPLTRELISNLLEAVGYDTLRAADGAEALDVLDSQNVDLTVTDLEMPGVDGLELTRLVKSHPDHSHLPVVILTTRGGEADRRRGLEAGADGYITKGDLVRQDLVDVVGRLLT